MGHVFFTGPQQLDRFVDSLGNFSRLHNKVQLQTATETATQVSGLEGDVFGLHVQHSSHSALRALLELGGANQQNLVALHMGGEVHRLQRRVRLHGRDVLGLHHFGCTFERGGHIALGLGDLKYLAGFGSLTGGLNHRGIGHRCARALVPLNFHSVAGLFGTPPRICHHGHAVTDLHHSQDAGHALGLGAVKALDLATDHGALLHGGIHHAGQFHIDTNLGRAVDFGRCVHALDAFTDDAEIFGVFDRWLFWHRQ